MLEKEGEYQWEKFTSQSELKQGNIVLFQYGVDKDAKVELMMVCQNDDEEPNLFLKSSEDSTERSLHSFTNAGTLMNIRGGVSGTLISFMSTSVR